MKTLDQIQDILQQNDIIVRKIEEGFELESWTKNGVNQIIFLDYRDENLNINSSADFLKLLDEWIENFDIDDEVDLMRGSDRFKEAFTISEAVNDYSNWINSIKEILKEIQGKKTSKSEQASQRSQNKMYSIFCLMDEIIEELTDDEQLQIFNKKLEELKKLDSNLKPEHFKK